MDFDEQVRWHNPLSWMQSLPSRESFNRASRQQRKTFPEIHMMKILEKQGGGKFKLEAPWGGVLDRVPCADFNIVSLLEPDMIVAVRYDIVDSHNCYIRNIAPSKIGVPSEIVVEPEAPETMYQHWVQAFGNPGLTRGRISAVWDPEGVGDVLWTGSGVFASVPHGVVFGGGLLITAQAVRNEANTAWEAVTLYIGEDTYTAALGSSPSFLVGYGDLWCNVDGDLVLLRLGPHLQQLYRLREGTFEQITLSSLGSRTISGANMSLSGKFVLGDSFREIPGDSAIVLNFGGLPSLDPTVTLPQGNPVNGIQCWDTNTDLSSLAESWEVDPTDPLWPNSLDTSWVISSVSQLLPLVGETCRVATAWVRRPLPQHGAHDMAVLWGFTSTLPGGNWSGDKATFNNYATRRVCAILSSLTLASGATIWHRKIEVDTESLPVITDEAILGPLTDFFSANQPTSIGSAGASFGGVAGEEILTNPVGPTSDAGENAVGQLLPIEPYGVPYRRFSLGLGIVLFPADRNEVEPTEVESNLDNFAVFTYYPANPQTGYAAGGSAEVVCDAAGNAFWAYAQPISFIQAGGTFWAGGVLGSSRGDWANQLVAAQAPGGDFVCYHNPDYFPLYGRFVEKVSPSGALVWRSDLTQLVAGMAWYRTESELGVPNLNVIGGSTSTAHPMGDNIQWVRPCGRVVFVAADMRTLGPNYQPTLQLLVLSDASGGLLHTVGLLLDDEVLAETVYATGFTSATGDGVEVYFSLYVGEEVAEILEVRIDGVPTVAYDVVINVDNFEITFYDPPAEGAVIDIDYRLSEVVYRAGEYLYDVQSAEIRHGQTAEGTEWAVIFVTQQSREATPGNYPRTILVQLGTNLTTPPTVTTHARTWTSPSTLALSNGQLVDLVWTGTEWTAVAY